MEVKEPEQTKISDQKSHKKSERRFLGYNLNTKLATRSSISHIIIGIHIRSSGVCKTCVKHRLDSTKQTEHLLLIWTLADLIQTGSIALIRAIFELIQLLSHNDWYKIDSSDEKNPDLRIGRQGHGCANTAGSQGTPHSLSLSVLRQYDESLYHLSFGPTSIYDILYIFMYDIIYLACRRLIIAANFLQAKQINSDRRPNYNARTL